MTQLFLSGQKVQWLGAHAKRRNRRATVVECINAGDEEDITLQGPRYYISYKGAIWSVPQWALRAL